LPESLEEPVVTQDACLAPRMRPLTRHVRKLWPQYRSKVMYLIVGACNSLFSYGCFSLLYYLLHEKLPSPGIVVGAYAIASIMGFLTMRYLVFKPVTHPLIEYLRYQVVYVPILMVNLAVLPLALRYSELNAYIIQALFAIFAIIAGYLGNKYFAFRKSRPERPPLV
jgi:putative flippase GtrA